MDDTAFFVLINWHNIFDSLVHVTCSHLRLDIDRDTLDIANDSLDLFIEELDLLSFA